MPAPERFRRAFNFALSRLIARLGGGSAARTQKNWWEGTAVGTALFFVSYIAVFHLLVPPSAAQWKQFLLLVPIAIFTWLLWIVVIFINTIVIRLLRACGFTRDLSVWRVQSVLIGITTSALACYLSTMDSWIRWTGILWLAATALNLIAVGLLALTDGTDTASR